MKIEEYSHWGWGGYAIYSKMLREWMWNGSCGMASEQPRKHFILCSREKLDPMRVWEKNPITDVVSKGRLRVAMSARISKNWQKLGGLQIARGVSVKRNGFCSHISLRSTGSIWAPAFLGIFHNTQKPLKSVGRVSDFIKCSRLYFCCFLSNDGTGRKIGSETNCGCCIFLSVLLKLSLGQIVLL